LTLALAALAASAGRLAAQGPERVDLLLVLAADTSSSMKEPEFRLQRSGYAAAFRDSRVISAIRATPTGRIAVTFVEWSGPWLQKVVIEWTLIDNKEAAHRFSDRMLAAPRAFSKKSTAIGAAIEFCADQFSRAPFRASRHIIDISGDGDNNTGRKVAAARDEAVAEDITINGLVILGPLNGTDSIDHSNPPGGLAHYYRSKVIGGAGAFVAVAEGYGSFGDALVHKLVREIAMGPEPAAELQWHHGPGQFLIR
jgi:hypothetical protein